MNNLTKAAGIVAGVGMALLGSRAIVRRKAAKALRTAKKLPSYQTAPLTRYHRRFQALARDIFGRVHALVGSGRARRWKGSYSFFAHRDPSTQAKIVIFESGKGKVNGEWPVEDGVYVFTRCADKERDSIGVAPAHGERFKYKRVTKDKLNDAVALIFEAIGQPKREVGRVEPRARDFAAEV